MNHQEILYYLSSASTEPVRDPLWKHIYLSKPLKKIAQTQAFLQLEKIKQLGPTYFVYPGATHTRLSHSLGVYETAKRMIIALAKKNEAPELSLEGVKSFLVAALLHDTGHFPFAHSLKELPLKKHETITAELILSEPLKSLINQELGANSAFAASIVAPEMAPSLHLAENRELHLYQNILSGVLDPDKLDYLNRDAFFCGIPYGLQDTDFVIDRILPNGYDGIAIDPQGITAIENLLFSKYLMYKSVYWHKKVRIATAMIKQAILWGMTHQEIQPDDLYGLDDEAFYIRFSNKRYQQFELVEMVNQHQFYSLIQEVPFCEKNSHQQQLLDLSTRRQIESNIENHLGIPPCSLIIDIPEPINFETHLPILKEGKQIPFHQSGTLFSSEMIKKFQSNLRQIRFLLHPKFSERKIQTVKEALLPYLDPS